MTAQENKQMVQQLYRMFRQGDIAGILAHCSDDSDWISPESELVPFSGHFHGKPGLAEFFTKLGENMQAIRFEPLDFIADGDKVVAMGESSWLVRSTGRRFDSPWVHVLTIRDGQMVGCQALTDTAATVQAFLPEPAAQASPRTQLHH